MKCNEIKALLSAYADGELSDELKNSVDNHIAECAACKELLAEQVKLHGQIGVISKTPALPDMQSRIMTAVTNTGAQKKTRPWLRPVLAAAPLVLALAIILPIIIPAAALTPEKVLAKANTASEAVKSFRMSCEFYSAYPVANEYTLTIHDELEFSGDRYMEKGEFVKSPTDTWEVIGNGDTAYGKHTGNTTSGSGMSASEWQQDIPSEITSHKLLDKLGKIEAMPDETIDGVLCYHFRGAVDLSKDSYYPEPAIIYVEFWIGKDDYIIRQYKSDKRWTDDATRPTGSLSFMMVWKYYDFNVQISIDLPQDAQGNLLPGWQVVPIWNSPG